MTNVPTIFDRLADDLASFEVSNITIALSPESGMGYEDYLSLKQSVFVRHPSLTLSVILPTRVHPTPSKR